MAHLKKCSTLGKCATLGKMLNKPSQSLQVETLEKENETGLKSVIHIPVEMPRQWRSEGVLKEISLRIILAQRLPCHMAIKVFSGNF